MTNMIQFRTVLLLLLGLGSCAVCAQVPSAATYSIRTAAEVTALIPYTTVIVPGDGTNTVTVIQQPAHGSVSYPTTFAGSGQQFSYEPAAGYVGLDSFYYRVTDQSGDVSFGLISINVGNIPAAATADDLVVQAGVTSFLDILFNDTGFADPVSFSITQQPVHGSLIVDLPDPLWQWLIGVSYTPDPGYTGPDQFQYQIGDGIDQGTATVMLTVSPDTDGDGLLDLFDNCPAVANPDQRDSDGDGAGNVCDTDDDNDGLVDTLDNCTLVSNTAAGTVPNSPAVLKYQLDSDADGYGNVCDADLNNSGLVTSSDYTILRGVLNEIYSSSANAAKSDLNGSGMVTSSDYGILRNRLNAAPGPSGLHP